MHVRKGIKAVATLVAILLMLISAIFGALLAYMWTMAPFYLEPNTVDLVVTNLNFPVDHGNYFDLTVMNPSHSVSGINITDIYIDVSGLNKTSITASDPVVPIFLDKGTQQAVNCSLNWGGFAGNIITVHVATSINVTASLSAPAPAVKITVDTVFDASESVDYFNGTITVYGPINLTLTQILLDYNPVDNISLTRNSVLPTNQTIPFTCYVDWEGHVKPFVQVLTREQFEGDFRSDAVGTVILHTTQVDFDESNTNQVNLTLFNSGDSATYVNITTLSFKYGNITDTFSGSLTTPSLPLAIDRNQTVVVACPWNWTDASYRNMDVTVTANTTQGFASVAQTVRTPGKYAGSLSDVNFDLDNTGNFSVIIANRAYSLQTANVTLIEVNQNAGSITPALIEPGANATFNCIFNWSSLVGQNVTVRAHLVYNSTEVQLTYNLIVPYLKITSASFIDLPPETPYVNLTIRNSEFSKTNATIVQVVIMNGTTPLLTIGSSGYEVNIGSETEIACSWNWGQIVGRNITVVMTTAGGFQVSATFKVE